MSDIQMKPWSMVTLEEQRDPDFLIAMTAKYREAFGDSVESNADYVKLCNAKTKLADKLEKAAAKAEKSGSNDYGSLTDEQKMNFVCELLNPIYRMGTGRDKTMQMFRIKSLEQKTVEIVDSRAAIDDLVCTTIASQLKASRRVLAPRYVYELAGFWKLYGEQLPSNHVTYAGFDPDVWCLGRSKHAPAAGDMPTWDNLLKRVNDREAFCAWIYGVASKRYRGRQVLWLHGDNGEDGKSFIQKIIAKEIFPDVSKAMSNASLSEGAARFMAADFEGKALAYWDDCNNTMALMREDIKQLSSGAEGNETRVEKKGKQSYDAQLEARMWINSNFAPVVSSDNYVRSRLLYIHISALNEEKDVSLRDKFINELPALLAYGKTCFEKLCGDERVIEQNDSANEAIDTFVTEFEADYESILYRFFKRQINIREGVPLSYTRTAEIQPVLERCGLKTNVKKSAWYDWLKKRHGAERKLRTIDGKKVQVIEGYSLNIVY